jgi:ribosomal protein S18 acetylase RimI-like enzyme
LYYSSEEINFESIHIQMEFKFRKSGHDELDQLQALSLAAYSQHQTSLTEENWGKMRSFIANRDNFVYLLDTSTCIVCEHEGVIVGMACFVSKGHPTDMFQSDWSYIRMLGVHPDFTGNGIAKQLTQKCINFARQTQEQFIALHTSEFMNAARHIYESMGFQQIKELEMRYGKRYWVYLLEL